MQKEKVVVAANGLDIGSPPGATLAVMRGQVNLGPRLRGDGVRLTTNETILPCSRGDGSPIF